MRFAPTLSALGLMASSVAWGQANALELTVQFAALAASPVPVGGTATWLCAAALAGVLAWRLRGRRLPALAAVAVVGVAAALAATAARPVLAGAELLMQPVALTRSPTTLDLQGAQRYGFELRNETGQAQRLVGLSLGGPDAPRYVVWGWGALPTAAPRCEPGLVLEAGAHCTALVAPRPEVGQPMKVLLKDLHPTQPSVGYDQIYYHLARKQPDFTRFAPGSTQYADYIKDTVRKRLSDYCADNGLDDVAAGSFDAPSVRLIEAGSFRCTREESAVDASGLKTAVLGPGGQLYLTDGHHGFTTLWELADGGPELPVWIRLTGDFSAAATPQAFWQTMQDTRNVWLFDADGAPIAASQLPEHLGLANLHDDAYRSLVYFTRDLGYSNAQVPEFAEFFWGQWLRSRLPLTAENTLNASDSPQLQPAGIALSGASVTTTGNEGYLSLVRDAALAMTALAPTDTVGGGLTAADLGQRPAPADKNAVKNWNDTLEELGRNDVKKSGDYRKGGKAWYAKHYRQCGGAPSEQPACWRAL